MVDNTPEEILDLVKEMNERLDGTFVTTEEDEDLFDAADGDADAEDEDYEEEDSEYEVDGEEDEEEEDCPESSPRA